MTTTSGRRDSVALSASNAVGRLANHLDVVEGRQELAQATADHRVIVDEEHARAARRALTGARTPWGLRQVRR